MASANDKGQVGGVIRTYSNQKVAKTFKNLQMWLLCAMVIDRTP